MYHRIIHTYRIMKNHVEFVIDRNLVVAIQNRQFSTVFKRMFVET